MTYRLAPALDKRASAAGTNGGSRATAGLGRQCEWLSPNGDIWGQKMGATRASVSAWLLSPSAKHYHQLHITEAVPSFIDLSGCPS